MTSTSPSIESQAQAQAETQTQAQPQHQAHKDKTFRNYDASSAAAYAQYRPPYPDKLIDIIIDKHVSTGGRLDLLLDVGCGPGTATRSLAPRFTHAVAADPGQSMVEMARQIPSTTRSGEPVRFEVCEAEKLSRLLPVLQESAAQAPVQGERGPESGSGSASECVDLITAATAAHWFDMPAFYREAAKILRPGGSIIIWCTKGGYCTPDTPNAEKLTRLFQEFEDDAILEFEEPGNRMTRDLYAGLPLPWDGVGVGDGDASKASSSAAATGATGGEPLDLDLSTIFPKDQYQRLEFNKDGHVPPGEQFLLSRRFTLDQVKKALGTVSPVTRWREAYKDKLAAGEVEDCVDKLVRQTRELLEESQTPEGEGKPRDWIEGGSAVVVLVIKKRK
ncbi:hypothetical protein A1O3_02412 [Capronia epimyces CBS 606.96]|uniref:Methyltransferase type 12 domain-containing protein n=1 Tax=Capronia epimyces CBS 606.96 TaxID=1182542 RepID=W9YI82_9EURO|nr:uncharacterized protein A1O3_02412 [Capronia epimyces CBS 606.96]EXJ89345.1 hypothetical protein A1O3_02412 [Capronia epimyces CBS 606.96]